ncbi:MAG: phage capsid protein [Curvibacter lanceolatus]|uniref:recombination directionality factor n=1 Tax=Curvibacter lanceolatus TaxID=86182 RepID=UPI000371ABF2|nr:hypothetical protein [Curvibacter lanceolatus]MBV5295466.1 phage capsid protein [Curvibacter lanceolatus]
MLKGLALTPPVLGRISIGRVVEKAGKRLPEKDDEFTITSQVQTRGAWVNHPVDAELRKAANSTGSDQASIKLRSIPVRLLFDDPDLNLRANYSLFDRKTGRPLCVGNGETCRRSTSAGVQTLECASPEGCELGMDQGCKPYGRLNVRIDVDSVEHTDELGSFVFRTTGFNSIRTLAARLQYFQAITGGKLSAMPLELRLRGKSTAQSHRSAIFYVDLTVRGGMTLLEAMAQTKATWAEREAAGLDQAALDAAAKAGLALGAFEESAEDGAAVVEEFYPVTGGEANSSPGADQSEAQTIPARPTLSNKLEAKAALLRH